MYMKQENLDAARHLMEEWKKVDPNTPLYSVALMIEELIKRGDDFKEALQSMWDAVAYCEPNTLGHRVYREIIRSRALTEYKNRRDGLLEDLREIRSLIIDQEAHSRSKLVDSLVKAGLLARIDRAIERATFNEEGMDKLKDEVQEPDLPPPSDEPPNDE